MGHAGVTLTPGFDCGCKRHVELHDGAWVVRE
jgi:hypothetical protein